MPWVNEEMCTGCEICIDECHADAIAMNEGVASIDDEKCIRCGVCHDACPADAVRHDGERIPEEVELNIAWVKEILNHDYYAGNTKRQEELIDRMKRYFTKEKKVVEQTIERLAAL